MDINKQLKLPVQLINNTTAQTIKKYLQNLNQHSGYMSNLLYKEGDKYFFKIKDQVNHPSFIPFDWAMYSLMRVNARTIVTSGLTLRNAKIIYAEDRGIRGKQQIRKLYDDNFKQAANLFVHTRMMVKDQIQNIISKQYFKYIPFSDIGAQGCTIMETALKINGLGFGPVLYQYGQAISERGIAQIKNEQPHFLQLIILCIVVQRPQTYKYIGRQFDMQLLKRDFNQVWESELFNSLFIEKGVEKTVVLQYIILQAKAKLQIIV